MKKTKTKCYLYTRVSTSMQVDGYSLDAQRDKLRKYAEYEDMVVAGEYSDEGFSGKNIQGRHEFQRMLQDIQDCKDGVEYVLVFKLSRFGRNAADVLNSLQLMQDFGVNLICVEDGIDSSKDSGKLMISVLSAVAEIERENIRTQTMAGREQKAREGKWNGGFAPYGYRLEKGELLIAEDEVDVIRTIFDRYIHTNDGVSGVAKYLNRQGFVKKLRQNGTIPGFSASFVKSIIDNPVYMGKIAYGRRRTEKKIGTRNEMHVVEQSEFPVYEGKHEAIISEEDWNLAQEKRKINAYRREKVNDPTHAHILSGILKCPCCGKSLYGNIAKAHSKDKKTRYYYYCKNTVTPTGHECTFRLNIEQTEMNRMVASIISAMVSDPRFANAIKAKIGSAVDTNDLEKQLEALQAQLRQTLGTKARLERQMDGLDVNDPYYDRKISDLQRRYDEQYGRIDEIEVQIDDVQSQIRNIRQEKISGDNIYRLLLAFDQVYEAASEVERKEFMRAFIERIELFPEKQLDGNWIRKIIFNFPVPVNGTEVKELPLENETMVEAFVTPWNLTDRSIVWSSSDEKIATVDANGVVTAVSEGTAVITAASKLDGTVKAECTITVLQNNTTLTGIVHNADGQSFVADIDVDSANYKYLTGALEQDYYSVVQTGDMLLASGDGNLYSLDAENGYAAKELCYTGDLFMSDMAYSPNLDLTLGTYGYYLMLVDPTTENGYRGLWNLQGAFTAIAGIAYAGHDSTYNYFYMLSASGTIHLIGIAPNGDGYTLSLLHTIVTDKSLAITGQHMYQSLYYDMETGWIYWARFNGEDSSSIIAINEETEEVVLRGTFDEAAWPVVGLFASKSGAMDLDRTGDFNFSETCTLAQTELSSQDAVALPAGSLPTLEH